MPCGQGNRLLEDGQAPYGLLTQSSWEAPMRETASDFIARKSAEWEGERARGKLIRMKDVNREAIHVYRRDAWTFLVQDTYAEAVNVLERLTHLETIGVPAVPMKLPAAEYRLGYFIVGRVGKASGKWTWGQFSPIMSGRRPRAHRRESSHRGHPARSHSSCR
jgi:hypothetical protein